MSELEICPKCGLKLPPRLSSGRIVCSKCGWSDRPLSVKAEAKTSSINLTNVNATIDWDKKNSGSKFFYSPNGVDTVGPITADKLLHLHKNGTISDFTLCAEECRESYPEWYPVTSVTGEITRRNRPISNPPTQFHLLSSHVDFLVAVNNASDSSIKLGWLDSVNEDYISICPVNSKWPIHYAIRHILSICESPCFLPYEIRRPIDSTIKQGTLSKIIGVAGRSEYVTIRAAASLTIEIYRNVVITQSRTNNSGVGVTIGVLLE